MENTSGLSTGLHTLAAVTRQDQTALAQLPTPPPFRVLVAEDNPVFKSMLCNMLIKWGYQAVTAHDGEEAWRILQTEDSPRLAILDWMMPGLDGVEVCRRVRASSREPYVYIVLLTSRTNSQDLVEGMEAGADDYLTKPFRNPELRVRLRAGRRILDLQEQLLLVREALRVQATHDPLTGLYNRAAIAEILRNELARAARENQPIGVLLADLDWFKEVNDTYGHLVGDVVLSECAQRMKSVLRSYDSLARYGGEEFIAVLPACEGEAACIRGERIRQALDSEPLQHGSFSIKLSCSVGVAHRDSPTPLDAEALVREADTALYVAKGLGRNRVAAFAPQAV